MSNTKQNTGQPWKTDNWFVSPWNYVDEVTRDFRPPEKVKIHDITLRDGEQQAGVIFTKDDKIRIAEKLAEVGVHRIEAGMPAVSPNDEAAIREIVKRNLGPEIFAFCRCMVPDVELAADCGVDGIVIEIPASAHLISEAYRWPLEKAIDLSVKATAFAKEKGLYTVFFTIDATRTDLGWLLDLIDRVSSEGHMDAFTLVDTFGVLSPHAATYFTNKVRERVKKPLEIHFHSDFGLGVANTINAVLAGAEVIHSTVLGIGERAGNTPMEETVLAFLTMYGIDVGINYGKLNELSRLVRELSGVEVPACRPFIGDGAYTIESGIVTGWFKNAFESSPTTVFPVNPNFVGHEPPRILMGKKSGLDNIEIWSKKLGIELSEEEAMEVLKRVKLNSHDLKRTLTDDEFKEVVGEVKAQK
ncbi:MAG: pyruvate carboxyltransferase [Deltaproteobacteria bacterium]|nr:pyruvate carboxyltransferase [Deltaproteobacteria bacterium]MBW1919621.1 pyruvate carboxyltransferase [Deltaproteobacteria bacterium]MBW1934232.1 pyruvate carboxyltransferase [Deltaproteobacteria bacterium]MBW1976469.1 pyruvate carboxyltransferase [Deltaproteobacteria bacterium]MBW2044228.1 pyruvate carboxyltransferase [Deltaproteobacteria bacterium]